MNKFSEIANVVDVYLVGGAVRDRLSWNPDSSYISLPKDYDYCAVIKEGVDVDHAVSVIDSVFTRIKSGALVWTDSDNNIEISLARREVSTGNGYSQFEYEYDGVTIEEDLKRRDFTINAMAIPVDSDDGVGLWIDVDDVIDPFDGIHDIQNGLIRSVPTSSMDDDPVRAFRAVRFECQLKGFVMEPQTLNQVYCVLNSTRVSQFDDVTKNACRREILRACDTTNHMPLINRFVGAGLIDRPSLLDMVNMRTRNIATTAYDRYMQLAVMTNTVPGELCMTNADKRVYRAVRGLVADANKIASATPIFNSLHSWQLIDGSNKQTDVIMSAIRHGFPREYKLIALALDVAQNNPPKPDKAPIAMLGDWVSELKKRIQCDF
ncbi:tRNA nucleotidyltransferase [Vibrio phage EniLVp02]